MEQNSEEAPPFVDLLQGSLDSIKEKAAILEKANIEHTISRPGTEGGG
jgi:hypothetical protein